MVGNGVINWIEKWLTHRRQSVIVDGEISNWKSVLSWVPHGSVLGPILFLIYVNNLEDEISSKVLTFADDTKLFLLQCGLTTLETRRLRGNQIEVFNTVNGYEAVDKEGSRTRGHKAALVKEQCRLDMRKYSFSQRVINQWNKLPNDCVNASSVNTFKNRIDRYLIRAGYT